jgi:thioesterase domain-containing protein
MILRIAACRFLLADEQLIQTVTSVQQLATMETELEQALERVRQRKNSVTNAAYDLQATSTAIQRQVPTSKLLQLLSDQLLHQQLPSYQSLRHEISSMKLEDLREVPKNLERISDEQVYT